MSTASPLRERLGRPAEIPGDRPSPSGIRAVVELRAIREIPEPVTLARALRRFGLDLTEAHRVVTALVDGQTARAEGHLTIDNTVLAAISELGVVIVIQVGERPAGAGPAYPPAGDAHQKRA
ncbi:hypothetical protein [uncultured Methylobacterium sp.]|jgi:sugar phosphate isomerase/epimerase|uniref:hypothetical protein n=1 Tax=uncultured Methylobacterium sp. TaxID=157278 RepID=UPI002638F1C1|nr:hypothetical protein [uncultured Methylobacterium sp.]